MNLLVILMIVIVLAFGVVGGLWVLIKRDESGTDEENAVPITDISEIKKEFGAFDRDGFDTTKELKGIEKDVHEAVEKKEIILPLEENIEPSSIVAPAATSEEDRQKIIALEKELAEVKQTAIKQVAEARDTISSLRSEADGLKSKLQEERMSVLKNSEGELGISDIEKEYTELKQKIETVDERHSAIVEELKNNFDQDIVALNDQILQLEKENKTLKEKVDLKNTAPAIQSSNEEAQALKKMNQNLVEKLSALQYDLTKNYAQVAGLEKMCANYKKQVNQLTSQSQRSASVVS